MLRSATGKTFQKFIMKSPCPKFLYLLLFWATIFGGNAATVDSEGMPLVYLRGEFGYSNWMPDPNYLFTRDGDVYTLVIGNNNPVPEGKFKIGDDDWEFDFGAPGDRIYVDNSQVFRMTTKGANVYTHGIYSGTISFTYTTDNELDVIFNIDSGGGNGDGKGISGTLPVMYINVYTDESHRNLNNEVIDYNLSHKDYFTEAEYWIDLNGCEWMQEEGAESIGSESEPLPLQIKARGNWTRIGFSKKPFKIKLDKKQNLLGLTPEKNKHYALLAHADDTNGYLRNFTMFNLGHRLGLPWTPNMQPVELVINGDYRGLYFLTESVRVGDGRIEIAELDDEASDPELVSGGYIVELDNYDEENQIRMEEKTCVDWQHLDRLRITFDTPEVYSDLQKRFITDQFSAINTCVGKNSDDTWSYLDLDDAVRYYLACEIVSHTEAYHGSTYLYRDRGEDEKWHFSPLWDAGNAFRGHTDDFFYNCDPFGNTWIPSLRENGMFNDKVKETWKWFMQKEYPGIEDEMAEFAAHVQKAALSDYNRWKGEPHPGGGQSVADNRDMNSKLREVKDHLHSKISWLTGKFGSYSNGNYSEPKRDKTPAAELPEYAKAGIESITDDDAADAQFFNLQGQKVSKLQHGQIYIMKTGLKSRKILWLGE